MWRYNSPQKKKNKNYNTTTTTSTTKSHTTKQTKNPPLSFQNKNDMVCTQTIPKNQVVLDFFGCMMLWIQWNNFVSKGPYSRLLTFDNIVMNLDC